MNEQLPYSEFPADDGSDQTGEFDAATLDTGDEGLVAESGDETQPTEEDFSPDSLKDLNYLIIDEVPGIFIDRYPREESPPLYDRFETVAPLEPQQPKIIGPEPRILPSDQAPYTNSIFKESLTSRDAPTSHDPYDFRSYYRLNRDSRTRFVGGLRYRPTQAELNQAGQAEAPETTTPDENPDNPNA